LEDVSHDGVNDRLRQKRFMPREGWRLVKDRLEESQDAVVLVDDSVPDQRSSRVIEWVCAQYRGNAQRVGSGMGVGSRGQSGGTAEDCSPIAYRGIAPEVEGKTKNEHRPERFVTALDQQQLTARPLLCDGW